MDLQRLFFLWKNKDLKQPDVADILNANRVNVSKCKISMDWLCDIIN